MRRELIVFALAAALVLSVSIPVSGSPVARACRTACSVANVRASCVWLVPRARPCLRGAVRDCIARVRQGQVATCAAPAALPACLTNQACPYGSRCVDGRCQVVACTPGDPTTCSGHDTCVGGMCVVADCGGSDPNCPRGFHCAATDLVSGVCQPDDSSRRACTSDLECLGVGTANARCLRGVCAAQKRRRRCDAAGDCFRPCRTSRAGSRLGWCGAPGRCVCASCESDQQCGARFSCAGGGEPVCHLGGSCVCPAPTSSGGRGVCTSFETPPCTRCVTDGDCLGIDRCLQSATCG